MLARGVRVTAVIGVALTLSGVSAQAAEKDADAWRFRAQVYVWLPSCYAETSFPPSDGGTSVTVDSSNFETSLNSAFMGSFETGKGRWGLLSDFIYLDIQEDASAADQFVLSGPGGKIEVPVGAGVDATLRIRGWAALLAGAYTAVDSSRQRLDFLGGLRYLTLDTSFSWNIDAAAGSLPPQAASGSATTKPSFLDAVVGVRGRVKLGQSRWFALYHLDAGTGQSDLTWQAVAGVGYGFKWGELAAVYRKLDYELPSGSALKSLALGGPEISVGFVW